MSIPPTADSCNRLVTVIEAKLIFFEAEAKVVNAV